MVMRYGRVAEAEPVVRLRGEYHTRAVWGQLVAIHYPRSDGSRSSDIQRVTEVGRGNCHVDTAGTVIAEVYELTARHDETWEAVLHLGGISAR